MGELQVRGSSVFSGYLNDAEATAAAFTSDGWFRTGDLGYTLPEGRCVFLSRLKDSLRLRGFLVDPVEIEEHIATHPAVELAQVVGVNLGEGEIAVAFIQPVAGVELDADQIRQHCRESIANYKVPSHFEFVTTFPRVDGANGQKVQKEVLRQRALVIANERA
jgi:fatty-acyl-CoA synthase